MRRLLYSIYTEGFPNANIGGPNHIIYDLIYNNVNNNVQIDYLSYDYFLENMTKRSINKIKGPSVYHKRITNRLFLTSSFYRKIVTSDFYFPIHIKKKEKKIRRFDVSNKNYNLIHSQDSLSLACLSTEHYPIKKIVTIHSNGPLSKELIANIENDKKYKLIKSKLESLEKHSLGEADIITFPSNSAKDILEEYLHYNIDPQKIKIIYNGIDSNRINNIKESKEVFEKYSITNDNKLIILNVSTYRAERRLDVLLKVIQILKEKYKKNVCLINIGDGPKHNGLKNLIKKLELEDNVKLLSNIPNDDVIRLMKVAAIFLMTSEKVIFDLVVLEALAAGACCVVSNDGGNKEIIKDGENGYLIDIDDVDKIAKKIISINANKVKANAIKTAKQFSVQRMVNEYFDVYESLLDGI